MNSELLFEALGEVAAEDILRAGIAGGYLEGKRKARPVVRIALVAAAVLILLAGAVGAKMVLGVWNDRWVQTPASDPEAVVRDAIENQMQKEYTRSVRVVSVTEDAQEAEKVWTGAKDSMLARQNGQPDTALSERCGSREDFKALYCVYEAEYEHTETWYADGKLGQWFYLIRDGEGKWEIWESCDPVALDPPNASAQEAPPEPANTDGAVEETIRMVKAWEQFDDVASITVEKAVYSPEQTARALEALTGSSLAAAEAWTEEYLRENMAAVEITYTTRYRSESNQPTPASETETGAYYLLRDPATGQWKNSEITGFMDAIE